MLKKLQNLLFEDEDDEEEEDEEVEVEKPAPAPQPRPAETPAPKYSSEPAPAPAVKEEKPHASMQRIDVTQPLPTVHSQPTPVEKKQVSLGITADDTPAPSKTVVRKQAVKPSLEAKKEEKPSKPKQTYEFKPVISPIFGVDEKDVTAMKDTAQRITRVEKKKEHGSSNISPIISPMYGPEASSNGARSASDATVFKDDAPVNDTEEDDLPDFSLDDILKSRDDEFKSASEKQSEKEEPLFPDLEDEELPPAVSDTKPEAEGDKPSEPEQVEDEPDFPDLNFDDDDDDLTSVISRSDTSAKKSK